MSEALRWWLILQLTAFFLLPLCLGLFARLPDRGYALSKPFGLLFVAYLFWLLNSLHVLPNSAGGITFAMLALGVGSAAFGWWRRTELVAWFQAHWRYVLGVEALLFVVFLVAVWLRMQVGAIGGTEQPMDLMYINAATHAAHFPPQDPWLSGHTVAYYYFGYLIVAMVGRMAGTAPEVSYNLGLALVATLLAIWLKVSTALSEIVVGSTVAQLVIGAAIGGVVRDRPRQVTLVEVAGAVGEGSM